MIDTLDMKRIIAELETQAHMYSRAADALTAVYGAKPVTTTRKAKRSVKRNWHMSAAGKARIRAAAKARWAAWHKTHAKKG